MEKQYMNGELTFDKIPIDGGFRMDGYWVWCGSVVEEPGNGFHMYAARWPKTHPMFEGYILLSEIVRAWAPNMTGPYEFVEKVLPSTSSPQWCNRMVHNPTVLKYGNKYLLYFIGSTYDHEVPAADRIQENKDRIKAVYNKIKIGVAISDTPVGPWQVCEQPLLESRPDCWDGKVVTNPAPCIHPDGRIFLYYRSGTPNVPNRLQIGLAVADSPEGPYTRIQNGPVINDYHVEDPFVWHNGNCFNMLAKDISGNITGEANAGVRFISDDGIAWLVADNPVGYSKEVEFEDGSRARLGCLERPQMLFDENHRPKCFFAAAADGPGHFRNAINTWNIAVPLGGRQR